MARMKSGKLGNSEVMCNICGADKFTNVKIIRNGYVCSDCFDKGSHVKFVGGQKTLL